MVAETKVAFAAAEATEEGVVAVVWAAGVAGTAVEAVAVDSVAAPAHSWSEAA